MSEPRRRPSRSHRAITHAPTLGSSRRTDPDRSRPAGAALELLPLAGTRAGRAGFISGKARWSGRTWMRIASPDRRPADQVVRPARSSGVVRDHELPVLGDAPRARSLARGRTMRASRARRNHRRRVGAAATTTAGSEIQGAARRWLRAFDRGSIGSAMPRACDRRPCQRLPTQAKRTDDRGCARSVSTSEIDERARPEKKRSARLERGDRHA